MTYLGACHTCTTVVEVESEEVEWFGDDDAEGARCSRVTCPKCKNPFLFVEPIMLEIQPK